MANGLDTTIQGTLAGLDAESAADLQRQQAQAQAARARAAALAQQLESADQAPVPEPDPAETFINTLLGGTAGVLARDPRFAQRAHERELQLRQAIFAQRSANLHQLADQAAAAADYAQSVGDHAAEAAHRERLEKLHRTLDVVTRNQDKLDQQARDAREQQYALDRIVAGAKAQQQVATTKQTTKPPTLQMVNATNFHQRAQDADQEATTLENAGVRASMLPDRLQGERDRLYWGAIRSFVEAHLRRESGAAITDSELENAARTYFGTPGDSPRVLESKRKRRQNVLQGLKRAASASTAEAPSSNGNGEVDVEYVRGPNGWVRK